METALCPARESRKMVPGTGTGDRGAVERNGWTGPCLDADLISLEAGESPERNV